MDAALLATEPLSIAAPRYRSRNPAEAQAVQQELQSIVRAIIAQRQLHAVLQPIIATRRRTGRTTRRPARRRSAAPARPAATR